MSILEDQIKAILKLSICSEKVREYWLKRLAEGNLTRDESDKSHFCAYFLPYDPTSKKVFIVHHKKSGLWLAPGGHIDKGEELMQTLNREIEEELGVKNKVTEKIGPFLLTITPINNPGHLCREHLDVWYRIPTDGSEFNVDPREFHETRWLTIEEAKKLVTDPPNIEALDKMEILFTNPICN